MNKLEITLTQEEAASILLAHSTAVHEWQGGAVAERVREEIAVHWPELRAEYSIGLERGYYYVLAEHHSDKSTHPWLLMTELYEGEPSESNPMPVKHLYAAPEASGAAFDLPFCTALARESELVALVPITVPEAFRSILLSALESSDLKYSHLNDQALLNASRIVIARWYAGIDSGEISYNTFAKKWEM